MKCVASFKASAFEEFVWERSFPTSLVGACLGATMIRGAVDYIDSERIGGWIHSDAADLRGQMVLAFLDNHCVGAGRIEIFRQDLADAGLGDGQVGFNFGVSLPDGASLGQVVLKLENSDFALLQPRSRIALDAETVDGGAYQSYTIETVEWMRERGWLDQTEFDFLKGLANVGLYDRTLHLSRDVLADPRAEAAKMFEFYRQGHVDIEAQNIDLKYLEAKRFSLLKGCNVPIVAIAAKKGTIAVVEGSHTDENIMIDGELVGTVNYKCGADRLIFLDLRAKFTARGGDAVLYRVVSDRGDRLTGRGKQLDIVGAEA